MKHTHNIRLFFFLFKLKCKYGFQSLDQNGARAASLGFASLHKLGKHLKLPDGQGLSELINKGLIKKISIQLIEGREVYIKFN